MGEIFFCLLRKCRSLLLRNSLCVVGLFVGLGVWPSLFRITLLRMRGPLVEVWLVHRGCSAKVVVCCVCVGRVVCLV